MGYDFLKRYGGKISSEWFFSKALQILDEAPDVYTAADKLIEATDWVNLQLTGIETRNACTAGYKAMWGAVVAGKARGGYDNISDDADKMARIKEKTFKPIAENHAIYAKLFAEYKKLHDYFGRSENNVMKTLKRIKEEQY